MTSFLDLSQTQDAHIDQRLRDNVILWLTSVRPDGRPHAVAVWFLWDGDAFVIFSRPRNQKIFNIQQNSRVLLIVDDSHLGADPIVIEGEATLLAPGEIDLTTSAFVEKYGERITHIGYTPASMAAAYSQSIRVIPIRRL
jgi:PPOX class probable F420-dependent enzyme